MSVKKLSTEINNSYIEKALSVWEERRYLVTKILEKYNITNLLDVGCGEGKLLRFLANGNKVN